MAKAAKAHAQDDHHDDHHGAPAGITRWLYSTNHKDIGTMYLVFACLMFFVGGAMALIIRHRSVVASDGHTPAR